MPSCFLCNAPCIDSVVHMGTRSMDSKDLDQEITKDTPFGRKLRAIAEKVEAL